MTSTADGAPQLPEGFYVRRSQDVYGSTSAVQGPWDPGSQHGGPPSALLASAIEERTGRPGLRIVRVSVDFLGPIPVGELSVAVRVLRPGRRVQLAEAELAHDGKVVAVARAWQHAVDAAPDATAGTPDGAAPPLPAPVPDSGAMMSAFGYGRAIEWRTTAGSADEPGPGAVWARPRVPLIAGTAMTGLQRALVVADSANGISLSLPLDRFLSMPTSLNVGFLRHPAGPWVHMDARTDFSGDGVGLTRAELADESGLLAVVSQPLLIAARG
ncbi:thioesterase family protein [Streptomyces sp. SL13]|uniref:Thioesterase family protein n=1 Tax=Streptantibioticus silvisoli TaxID=2705255 RepID=A0AA90H4S6_9ACTN|nr:thioesterase family protein [Streptantibioticus silvisoli]MDI5970669.1 thioesterase family protein [Streptantibioticus silvisoli]